MAVLHRQSCSALVVYHVYGAGKKQKKTSTEFNQPPVEINFDGGSKLGFPVYLFKALLKKAQFDVDNTMIEALHRNLWHPIIAMTFL